MAFAGCNRGPAVYTTSQNPKEIVTNAESFVKQTVKRSSHYSAEDWQVAVEQFVAMSKNFYENKTAMTDEDMARFDAARLDFMKAVNANGTEELAAQIKEAYSNIVQ